MQETRKRITRFKTAPAFLASLAILLPLKKAARKTSVYGLNLHEPSLSPIHLLPLPAKVKRQERTNDFSIHPVSPCFPQVRALVRSSSDVGHDRAAVAGRADQLRHPHGHSYHLRQRHRGFRRR